MLQPIVEVLVEAIVEVVSDPDWKQSSGCQAIVRTIVRMIVHIVPGVDRSDQGH